MPTRRSFSTAAAPTTLTVGVDNAVASITVQDGSTYVDGTSGPSVLTIDSGKSNEERVLYTSRVGNVFSGLTRGYNGTAAQAHTAGAIVEHTSTQQDFDEANAHLADPTRNDHTQYARVAAANTFTVSQTVNAGITNPASGNGTVRLTRSTAATDATSLLFSGGVAADMLIARKPNDDSLWFGYNAGSGTMTDLARLTTNGAFTTIAQVNGFGRGVYGAANAYTQVGDDANGALIAAKHGTATTTKLQLQTLGVNDTLSSVDFLRGNGELIGRFRGDVPSASDTSLEIAASLAGAFVNRRVVLGAADSAGTGFRTLRVTN